MFRASRARRSDDPGLRMLLFAIGAVLGIAGMIFVIDWLVTAGIIVLGIGMVAGIRERRRGEGDG